MDVIDVVEIDHVALATGTDLDSNLIVETGLVLVMALVVDQDLATDLADQVDQTVIATLEENAVTTESLGLGRTQDVVKPIVKIDDTRGRFFCAFLKHRRTVPLCYLKSRKLAIIKLPVKSLFF